MWWLFGKVLAVCELYDICGGSLERYMWWFFVKVLAVCELYDISGGSL